MFEDGGDIGSQVHPAKTSLIRDLPCDVRPNGSLPPCHFHVEGFEVRQMDGPIYCPVQFKHGCRPVDAATEHEPTVPGWVTFDRSGLDSGRSLASFPPVMGGQNVTNTTQHRLDVQGDLALYDHSACPYPAHGGHGDQ